MLRLISSFLILLLGGATASARGARPRALLRPRWRQPADHEGAADRALEAHERPRARARASRWSWPGAVELVRETHTVLVPGTWTFEEAPVYRPDADLSAYEAPPIPPLAHESAAWASRMQTVLSLQEPGTRLRVGDADASGWKAIDVVVPTRPPTLVHVDRDALGALLGGAATIRLTISLENHYISMWDNANVLRRRGDGSL
jgi:hypothetical protein